MRPRLALLLVLVSLSGCTREDPLYCDEQTPCADPSRPFCDLAGEHPASGGTPRTCIPDPFAPDGGVDVDAGAPDAEPCIPGAFLRCDGASLITCDDTGLGEEATTCDHGCNADRQVCNDCAPGVSVCDEGELETCAADGTVESTSTCTLGCHAGGTRCLDVDPSNDLAALLDMAHLGPELVLATGTIDTDEGIVMVGGSPVTVPSSVKGGGIVPIRVFRVRSLSITGTIEVTGANALAFVSDGDVSITGRLTAAAKRSVAGPGSYPSGGNCHGGDGVADGDRYPGAGGGGFATSGGGGGNVLATAGGPGGLASGSATLEPLRGGCRGGNVVAGGSTLVVGGGGGGAVQITSRTRIVLSTTGIVDAGGGGTSGVDFFMQGGGGAGGGILLEAPVVEVTGSGARVAANGGGGRLHGPAGGRRRFDDDARGGSELSERQPRQRRRRRRGLDRAEQRGWRRRGRRRRRGWRVGRPDPGQHPGGDVRARRRRHRLASGERGDVAGAVGGVFAA